MQQQVRTDCVASFLDSIGAHPRVGDAIKGFKKEFFPELDICERCGLDVQFGSAPGRCKQCKTAHYCSGECQASDWKEGGHAAECAAIVENRLWQDYQDDIVKKGGPEPSSVVMRHYTRFAAVDSAFELIERGGGGFHGGGGGGGGFRGGGWGGRGGGGGGGFRGGGRGALPMRWGYRGYAFPWFFTGGIWYPWWFYLTGEAQLAAFYAARNAQQPYVDPSTGQNYGVPPGTAAPGSWGPVQSEMVSASADDVCTAWTGIDGLFGNKQGPFERLIMAHAKAVVALGRTKKGSKEREKAVAALNDNLNHWADKMRVFPARVAKLLDPSGRRDLGQVLSTILTRLTNEIIVAIDGELLPRSEESTKGLLSGISSDWADLWAILTIGTRFGPTFGEINSVAEAKRKLGGVPEIYEHAKRDMTYYTDCLLEYIAAIKAGKVTAQNNETSVAAAAMLGQYLDTETRTAYPKIKIGAELTTDFPENTKLVSLVLSLRSNDEHMRKTANIAHTAFREMNKV